jgi:hypothetical protein
MAGLVPAIHDFLFTGSKDVDARDKRGHDDLNERIIQVVPLGIFRVYEPHLPCAWPMFDVVLAVYENFQPVALCEARHKSCPMLVARRGKLLVTPA